MLAFFCVCVCVVCVLHDSLGLPYFLSMIIWNHHQSHDESSFQTVNCKTVFNISILTLVKFKLNANISSSSEIKPGIYLHLTLCQMAAVINSFI